MKEKKLGMRGEMLSSLPSTKKTGMLACYHYFRPPLHSWYPVLIDLLSSRRLQHCQLALPVRAVTGYAEFVTLPILLISQRENLLDPFNTRTVKVDEVVERIVFGRLVGNWRWVLSSTTDSISW